MRILPFGSSAATPARTPIRRIPPACWERTASGHAVVAAAPPRAAMNSRRRIRPSGKRAPLGNVVPLSLAFWRRAASASFRSHELAAASLRVGATHSMSSGLREDDESYYSLTSREFRLHRL